MLVDKTQQILRERAERLQKEDRKEENNSMYINGLEFLLANEKYIIPSDFIEKVILINDFTPLPCTPEFVLGIINYRGNILSIIDIKKLFGLPEKGITNLNRVIIVSHNDLIFGILADDIFSNIQVNQDKLQNNLSESMNSIHEFIYGLTPKGQIVLNMKAFMESEQIIVNE